jgi:histidinol dehydrogenase
MKIYLNPNSTELKVILQRKVLNENLVENTVKDVFEKVKNEGDKAISEFSKKFDNVNISTFLISKVEFIEAIEEVPEELKNAISQAAINIEKFHSNQKENVSIIETMEGVKCWRKSIGIEKVGIYIPGGTAPLFSTVLMLGIPARIAGCDEIVLCTPPDKNGKVNPAILYTANLIGISKVYKIGGIQAIAAMTYGTESIPNVYKIFGPGNQYVTAAKQYAQQINIAIDMPAGPSEVMVICDETSKEQFIAADLLSQAEHGIDSQVVLVSDSEDKISLVNDEIKVQLENLPRRSIIEKSLENSIAILTQKINIVSIINQYAPEHLILNTSFNEELILGIKNAGSVFIGEFTPESAGDYASGTNHTLPTNGFSKQYSGVSLDSFVKKITFQEISRIGIKNIGKTVEIMAEAEGLLAHKNAITIRLNNLKDENK